MTRDLVRYAKPDPDSSWPPPNTSRCRSSLVGGRRLDLGFARGAARPRPQCRLRSGGYGGDELREAGAYRVYDDPADILRHLDEVGVRGT